MGVNYFIFNGESSLDFGIYVGGQHTFNAPQRDVSKVAIPGRNGDLIKDNGRWLNVEVPYNLVFMDCFREKAEAVRSWLCEPKTYVRLEDTYHPEFYRLARFVGPVNFETMALNRAGRATVTFDCKPQRFLKDGEALLEMEDGGFIYNPTRFESKPLIRVLCTGDGSVTIGDYEITLDGITTYVDIDAELQDCYAEGLPMNNKVTLSDGFPILAPGKTEVGWSGDVEGVSIAGRWFTV